VVAGMNNVLRAWAEAHSLVDLLHQDTHRVAISVTIIKHIQHQAQVAPVDIFQDTGDQMVVLALQ
jgi:hypothetical protein